MCRSQIVRIDDLDRGARRQRLGQHHKGRRDGRDLLIGRPVHIRRKCLRKVCRSAVIAPRIGPHRIRARAVDAFERDFRNASGQHIIARGKAYGRERMGESQRSGRSGIAGYSGGGGDEQIPLGADGFRDRIGNRRSAGLRRARKGNTRPVIGCVGEEADIAPAVRPMVRGRPRRCLRHLDVVHIIRQTRGFAPRARINRSQDAERVVEIGRLDGCGTGLRPVGLGIRLRCGDSVGDRGVQEQSVGGSFALQRKNGGRLFRLQTVFGGPALRSGAGRIRFGDLEAQISAPESALRCRIFRAGGEQKCRRNRTCNSYMTR